MFKEPKEHAPLWLSLNINDGECLLRTIVYVLRRIVGVQNIVPANPEKTSTCQPI